VAGAFHRGVSELIVYFPVSSGPFVHVPRAPSSGGGTVQFAETLLSVSKRDRQNIEIARIDENLQSGFVSNELSEEGDHRFTGALIMHVLANSPLGRIGIDRGLNVRQIQIGDDSVAERITVLRRDRREVERPVS